MIDITDSELIMLIRENNEEASEVLNNRYSIIIKKIIYHNYALLEGLKESNNFFNRFILDNLDKKELTIFSLLLDGLSYKEIAYALTKNYHQVYRTVASIKKKLKPLLLEFN